MRNISFIDRENLKFPLGSREYKELVKQFEKTQGQKFILCFDNTSSSKVSKTKPIDKVVEQSFTLPYANNVPIDTYSEMINLLKTNHFYKTMSSIPGIKIISKNVAEFTPFLSQICAGVLLVDKKGKIFVLSRTLEDGTEQLYLPQTHIEYTEEMFIKTFEELINQKANDCLNDSITIKRKKRGKANVDLLSGCVVHTATHLETSMHTLFVTIYQVDNFSNYDIHCKDDLKGVILEAKEIQAAVASNMMDPWLTYIYTEK